MRIRKYDFNYSRRVFMEKAALGATAGVLMPLWPLIADGADMTKAYPDELLSIEAYTKGKLKTGDMITADNVEVVKELLDPVAYKHVKEMGRRIKIAASTKDITRLYPNDYLEATLKTRAKPGSIRTAMWLPKTESPGSAATRSRMAKTRSRCSPICSYHGGGMTTPCMPSETGKSGPKAN